MDESYVFEYPVIERVRTYMRIESLFTRFVRTAEADSSDFHHLALSLLFEIMECASRIELKLNILQDLERQKQCPKNDESMRRRLALCAESLQSNRHKFGQHLRENEWLMNLRQHMAIAGGVNPVELPSYDYWQKLPVEVRRQHLRDWSEAMMPTGDAVCLLMSILRANSQSTDETAKAGGYTKSGPGLKNIDLLRLETDAKRAVLPEISVNKYMMHIRFVTVDFIRSRGTQTREDIPFRLHICGLERPANKNPHSEI